MRLLFVEDALLPSRSAAPARLDGPRDPGPTALVQDALPLLARADVSRVGLGAAVARHIRMVGLLTGLAPLRMRVEPAPHLDPERALLRRFLEVHDSTAQHGAVVGAAPKLMTPVAL